MPVLVVDGEIQAAVKAFRAAGPCEWCGRYVSRAECGTVTEIFDGDRPAGVERLTVLTRMCSDCIDAYALLGRDGVRE